jgi:shikimate kinase
MLGRAQSQWCAADLSRIVLTGFMGSGKSTIGRLLAMALGWEFIDVDRQIEQENGETSSTLFAILGETGFREVEAATTARCLEKQKIVLALGGAAIDLEANRHALVESRATLIVFLDGEFDVLIERCRLEEHIGQAIYRPLLHKKAVALSRFKTRRELNMTHAHLMIDVSNQTCEISTASILQHLGPAILIENEP